MKTICIFIFITIFTSACSQHRINSYNISVDSNSYQEYFINEIATFLISIKPPAQNKLLIVVHNDKDKYLSLLLEKLRIIGYSVEEITEKESKNIKVGKNEFLLTYSIDNLSQNDGKDSLYIGLLLTFDNQIYSKIYNLNAQNDLPQPIGHWSVKSL